MPPLGTWGAPTIYLVPPGYTMSALPPKADMDQHGRDVRFVPKAISTYLNAPEGAVYGFAPSPPSGPIWKGAATVAPAVLKDVLSSSRPAWQSIC